MTNQETIEIGRVLEQLFMSRSRKASGDNVNFVLPDVSEETLTAQLEGAKPATVFVPMELCHSLVGHDGLVVDGYEGDPSPGEEILIEGETPLAFSSYGASAYVPLTCATVLCVADRDDWIYLLEDADMAVANGIFPEQLLHPLVIMADACALAFPDECGTVRGQRRFIDEAGHRPSLLASARKPEALIGGECECLSDCVRADVLSRERDARPWLRRYFVVIEVLKALGVDSDKDWVVSGFGTRFADGMAADRWESPDSLVLVNNGASYMAIEPSSLRRFRIGRDAAIVLDATATTQSQNQLREFVGETLGVTSTKSAEIIAAVRDAFSPRVMAPSKGGKGSLVA
jgi:hypothetical protein